MKMLVTMLFFTSMAFAQTGTLTPTATAVSDTVYKPRIQFVCCKQENGNKCKKLAFGSVCPGGFPQAEKKYCADLTIGNNAQNCSTP